MQDIYSDTNDRRIVAKSEVKAENVQGYARR